MKREIFPPLNKYAILPKEIEELTLLRFYSKEPILVKQQSRLGAVYIIVQDGKNYTGKMRIPATHFSFQPNFSTS